jgi:hypothetical protein
MVAPFVEIHHVLGSSNEKSTSIGYVMEAAKMATIPAILGLVFLCHSCKYCIGLELVLGMELIAKDVDRFTITWIIAEAIDRHRESRFGPQDNLPAHIVGKDWTHLDRNDILRPLPEPLV